MMLEANSVFGQYGAARHFQVVGAGVFKLSTQKADVIQKKKIIQITEKYRVLDKQLRERLELGKA